MRIRFRRMSRTNNVVRSRSDSTRSALANFNRSGAFQPLLSHGGSRRYAGIVKGFELI